jgi:Tol biopolymer transport system component
VTENYYKMSQENFYSPKMILKTEDELRDYIDNQDHFQKEAVLAAIWELEKRGIPIENSAQIKEEITANIPEISMETATAPIENTKQTETPELYSTQFILIFGLFSLLGGGILMALNFMQLKNVKAARLVVIVAVIYSLLTGIALQSFGITNMFISLAVSMLGIYLLYDFVYKKEFPKDLKNYTPRNIWTPILILLALSIPLLYLLSATGNFPQ